MTCADDDAAFDAGDKGPVTVNPVEAERLRHEALARAVATGFVPEDADRDG